MALKPEVPGFVISDEGPNPRHTFVGFRPGPEQEYTLTHTGKIDIGAMLTHGFESGFTSFAQRGKDGEVVDFFIALRTKPDTTTLDVINEWLSGYDNEQKDILIGALSQIIPTCTISLEDGISVVRRGREIFNIKSHGKSGKLIRSSHRIVTEDGEQVRRKQKFNRRVPFFKYHIANILKPKSGKGMAIFAGARFVDLDFKRMNRYFSELIECDSLDEGALREFVDPFVEVRHIPATQSGE